MSDSDFVQMLKDLDIKVGDIVYIEADLSPDFYNPLLANHFFKKLLSFLGEEGTIVMSYGGYNHNLNQELAQGVESRYLTPYNLKTKSLYSSNWLANYLSVFNEVKISKSSFYPYVGIGKYADLIVNTQSFDFPNGSMSPLARLYELRAKAILINHDIKSLLLNKHYIEISHCSSVSISGGMVDERYESFLEKTFKEEIIYDLFNTKQFKELFYYTDIGGLSFLSISVREYVDYNLKYIER